MDVKFVCSTENVLEAIQLRKNIVNMTDAMGTLVLCVSQASEERNCDADFVVHYYSRLGASRDRVAGVPAIATLMPCKFICRKRDSLFKKQGFDHKEVNKNSSEIVLFTMPEEKPNASENVVCRAAYQLLLYHEARVALNAERRFPSASSLTGVFSIHNVVPARGEQQHYSSTSHGLSPGPRNSVRSEGWIVLRLPGDHPCLSFQALMQRWLGDAEVVEQSPLLLWSSGAHRHDCTFAKEGDISEIVPRFLARQSNDMIMFVFHTNTPDPSTVWSSFCKCEAAFRICFADCSVPEQLYSIAVATPFRSHALLETFKVIVLHKTLFLFLYKSKPCFGSWDTISIGVEFGRLKTLLLEPASPEPQGSNCHAQTSLMHFGSRLASNRVRDSKTGRDVLTSKQVEVCTCKSPVSLLHESPTVCEEIKPTTKAPQFARQHRSLSESCAYQIPECSRRGILKNGRDWRRTISESSDDFPYTLSLDSELSYPASSLDSIQPKKTVSFNDQISHIIYRANSSILARRRRNQKKAANKKKAAARRALSRSDSTDTSGVSSGSEASLEDVSQLCVQTRFEDSSKADQVVV